MALRADWEEQTTIDTGSSRRYWSGMFVEGPVTGIAEGCERVLRSLPDWFGIEEALVMYVKDVERLPTFVCRSARAADDAGAMMGFLTVREHFPEAWDVHCLAVHADHRRRGVGRALQRHVERWLAVRGVRFLQVKTIAAESDDPNYAETRKFYLGMGYTPLEVFPTLWHPRNPALQLVMSLDRVALDE